MHGVAEQPRADLERVLRQQESLREVIESISSELELQPLLTRIVQHACELLGADNGTIGLVDTERRVVRTAAVYRMPPDELGAEMPPGVGLAGQVLRTQQPIILRSYGEVAQPTQPGLVQNAVIGMPIFWRERMIGFFGLGSPPPREFTDQDAEVLSLFAKHAAIAIENARRYAREQRSLDEMQLLYETSRRISTAMDVGEVVAAYLEQVAARGRYACSVALYEMDESGEKTAVLVQGRWTPEEGMVCGEERVVHMRDSFDPLLDAGQTITVSDVHQDPRCTTILREIQIRSQRPALAMVPLMVRGRRIGLVILSYPQAHVWREADLRPYQATAAQLATAIDSRQQNLLLYERGQQVAVLEERQRLARELHDSVTQLLFSVTLIAQTIGPAWQRDPAEGERRVGRLLELSQAALAEMRALLVELRPSSDRVAKPPDAPGVVPGIVRLQREGLEAALRQHSADAAKDGLNIALDTRGYIAQPPETEEALYRITQEALNNVAKHAHAKRVKITLRAANRSVRLTVKDNGVGFAPKPPAPGAQGGMGLATMRERAEALGGTLNITSAEGSGTTVKVRLPAKEPTG